MEGNKEFTLASGAVLSVTVAPFADAKRLQNEVFKTIDGRSLSAMTMLELSMLVSSVETVESAFFKCAERALYSVDGAPGVKVTRALFDDPAIGAKAREDYQEIFTRVLEVNVRPFTKALVSVSSIFLSSIVTPTLQP